MCKGLFVLWCIYGGWIRRWRRMKSRCLKEETTETDGFKWVVINLIFDWKKMEWERRGKEELNIWFKNSDNKLSSLANFYKWNFDNDESFDASEGAESDFSASSSSLSLSSGENLLFSPIIFYIVLHYGHFFSSCSSPHRVESNICKYLPKWKILISTRY